MDIDLYNEITLPSTLITLGLDLLGDSVDTTLSGFAREISNSAVDQLVSFASQLEGAGLTVCNINDLEDANEGNPIGHGTTVSVFKCRWKSRNKLVAVKRMNLGIPLGTSMLEVHKEEYRASLRSLFLEFRVLNHTWFKVHPNFVDLYGVCWDRVNEDDSISGHRPSMIVELADESTPTLKELVNHHGQSPVDIELMLNLLTDTAEGMTMLHATKIVHGDLKPENILLFPSSKRLVAKISDFGFCSPFAEGKDQIGGTYYWNAPECMPNAPPDIKPFAMTLTRDLYSYALVMWFCLFRHMPFGHEDSATESEVAEWKLQQDPDLQLKDNIVTRSPGLGQLNAPILQELMADATPTEMLWFQIWNAMAELLKFQPNNRNIPLGEMHRVLNAPNSRSDIFVPRWKRHPKLVDKSHADDHNEMGSVRPRHVAGMSEALKSRLVSKYDVYALTKLPVHLQHCLLQEWEAKCQDADHADLENLDLLLVLALCSRTGFGGEKNLARAKELELRVARCGSDVAAQKCLINGLLNGFDPSITAEEQIAWLKTSISAYCIRKAPNSDRELTPEDQNRLDKFQDSLDVVLEPFLKICLFHSFIKAFMTDWEVLNGSFDGAAQDPPFCWAVNGDLSKLSAALDADPRLLQHRKAGFTLLHVAVDYVQEHVVRMLIQDYHFSPNTKSESDLTPIEIAVMTGSIDCLQLLLSLGADPKPLADQDLFTEVAITGSRGTPTRSVATGNRILLSTIAGIVSNMHSDGERSGEPCAAVQDLLNGRYQVDDGDIGQSGSPLELCISASNYDSVVALLGLGTNPNSINHTPSLHLTVSLREPVLVALLLAYGANPNLKGGVAVNEETALHQADVKSETMVHDLHRNAVTSYKKHLSKDVNPVETDSQFAILARTKACIDILLFNGADIEAQDRNGDTPLMLRVLQGDLETAQYLLDKGANLHAKDFDGMEVSDKVDSPEVLEWCIKFGPALATRHSSSLVKPATIA